MTKKFIHITGDMLLLSILFGIILVSVFSVVSMTPTPFEEEESVLGVEDDKVLENQNKFEIIESAEEHSFFSVESEDKGVFVQTIDFGPVEIQPFTKKLSTLKNNSDNEINLKIISVVPEEFKKQFNVFVIYKQKETLIYDSNTNEIFSINTTLNSNSFEDIYIKIEPTTKIENRSSFILTIEEI